MRKFWHFVKTGEDIKFPDCCVFIRSHTCETDDQSVRAVWEYPATITFGEAVFTAPLIQAYQRLPYENVPVAYGFEIATGGMHKLKDRFCRSGLFYGRLHFSKFDKTIPAWLIRIAFDILCCNIDFVYYEKYGVANAERMILMYKRITEYFINTTIQTARGLRFRKDSGIASGSYFAQLVGSIVNCILLYYACLQTIGRMPIDSVCFGDDSFLSTSIPLSIKEVSDILERTFGVSVNLKESQVSEKIDGMKFLDYYVNFN